MRRPNKDVVLKASGAVTADGTTNLPDLEMSAFGTFTTGIQVVVNISAVTSATVTVTIEGYNPATGAYYTLLASSALGSTGTTTLTVHPNSTAAANSVATKMLPQRVRVKYTVASAGTITFSISATLGN